MPTYEYRCPDGHDFEQFVQKISLAASELPCPVCGQTAARRMSAGGGFVFKGSGFYITDYGKDGKKDARDRAEKQKTDAAKAETAAKSEDTKRAEVKSEATSQGSAGDAERASTPPPKGDSAKSDSAKGAAKSAAKSAAKTAPAPPPGGGDKK